MEEQTGNAGHVEKRIISLGIAQRDKAKGLEEGMMLDLESMLTP